VVAGAEASLIWALEASAEELRLASYADRNPGGRSMLEGLVYQIRARPARQSAGYPSAEGCTASGA
jgi:hypothetical protein